MPRTYKLKTVDSRRKHYNEDNLKQAVTDVIDMKCSSYEAAAQYGVPRGTIARQIAFYKRNGRRQSVGEGRPTRLTRETEQMVVSVIQARASAGFPMEKSDLLQLITDYLINIGKDSLFPNNKPGDDWYMNFMRRWKNELTVRKPELLTLSRALACNRVVVDAWFEVLGNKMSELQLLERPTQIFNCDESGLSTNPGITRILTKRGIKNPVVVIPGSGKEQYTILALASASGRHYPPFVIFKGKNLYDVWMVGGPSDALYGTSDNGWMNTDLFTHWFKNGFLKWTEGQPRPLLLIFDGHMTHISLAVLELAIANEVHILCLPAHCSHLLQPLDVGVFKSAKDEWRKILKEWYKDSRMKSIDKGQFSKLLAKLYNRMKPHHATSGFSKCGVFPFDPNAIADDKLAPAATFDRPEPRSSNDPRQTASASIASTVALIATSIATVTPTPSQQMTDQPPEGSPPPNPAMPCTPRSAMTKAVHEQLKVCNEAVRQKNVKRKISKQFGGECLTEKECIERLKDTLSKKKIPVKRITKKKLIVKLSTTTMSRKLSRKRTLADSIDSDVEGNESDADINSVKTTKADEVQLPALNVGDFVKVKYDEQFYPAEITEIREDWYQCNCFVSSKSGWRWPDNKDEIWYQASDIVKTLTKPNPISARGVYMFENFD
jgi:DDE superfamily endonuclease